MVKRLKSKSSSSKRNSKRSNVNSHELHNRYIIGVIAIVAIVGLIYMFTVGSVNTVDSGEEGVALAGQPISKGNIEGQSTKSVDGSKLLKEKDSLINREVSIVKIQKIMNMIGEEPSGCVESIFYDLCMQDNGYADLSNNAWIEGSHQVCCEYAESQIYGASEEFCRGMCSWYLGENPDLGGYNQCLDTCM